MTEKQRHQWIQIVPRFKKFNFLYRNKKYLCLLCGEITEGNFLDENPLCEQIECQNEIHFCNR